MNNEENEPTECKMPGENKCSSTIISGPIPY